MTDVNLKRVAFVRHGETPLHVGANRFCGDLDPDLTAHGTEQAERAANTLAEVMPRADEAWMSPRLRARRTASLLLPSRTDWQTVEDLRELSFGEWEGLSKEEARALTPAAYDAWEEDSYRNGPPGGESGLQARPRIERVLERIAESSSENILIVSHVTYLRLLIGTLLGIELSEVRKRLDVQQGGVGLLEIHDGKGKLLALIPSLAER